MGESWSDLDAVEYLHENGYVPTGGENPFSVGAYATGNKAVGIRDYAINDNPLNYSDLGFDTAGAEVHADGEVWNAVNYELRQALVAKYGLGTPALQRDCAAGKYAADACPGNRRWIQIVYDAWLLMQSGVSMVDARNAYLAADMMRFGGANQTEVWRAFAKRGLGSGASSAGTADDQPTPSFEAKNDATNATITFDAIATEAGNAHVNANVYVGEYEARVTPIVDTNSGTPLGKTAKFTPGTYDFVVQAPGYGLQRFTKTFTAGQIATVSFALQTNWASATNGASATGDGSSLGSLIDDTEGTQWLYTNPTANGGVAGKQVTVKLAGGAHDITRVNASAMLQPGQNRFTALRSFELWTSDSTSGAACDSGSGFRKIYTSPADAFPGAIPRPVSPNLIARSLDVQKTKATHVRLVVRTNQCTGIPGIQTDSDHDPLNDSGCVTGSAQDDNVRAAELEVFTEPTADLAVTKEGPSTLKVGSLATYTISVTNKGPAIAAGVVATDTLPYKAEFKSVQTSQGTCTRATKNYVTTVTCNLGNMANGAAATITLVAKLRVTGDNVNTVTATEAGPGDPVSSNNSDTVHTNVKP
jgi:extracellular elastinolytic metalloproteinase